MSSPILLPPVERVRAFMHAMHPNARTRGEAYFNQGRVADLHAAEQGKFCFATVAGSEPEPYRVEIEFDDDEVLTSCTCPLGDNCKHIYATLKAMLVEHTRGRVQALSSKQTAATGNRGATEASFEEEVAAALKRPLKAAERDFLASLHAIYTRSEKTRHITPWDFQSLGFRLDGEGWSTLRIWPSFPKSLRQFWLYIAHAAQERELPLPEFMLPVTNLDEIGESVRRWKRGAQIERWKQTLGSAHPRHFSVPTEAARQIDLHIRFDKSHAQLEWRPSERDPFEPMKPIQTRSLQQSLRDASASLPTEAEWIWQALEARLSYSGVPILNYSDPTDRRLLTRFFRLPALHSRLVNRAGQPLAISAEPLRWQLDPAATENEDYRLRLVQPDGSPAPAVLTVLEGSPALYVGEDKVFPGPPVHHTVLDPSFENVIPAPALESHSGVALLRALKIELPPRLKERVRLVPMTLQVRCELKAAEYGRASEVCAIEVQSVSPDRSVIENWTGHQWSQESAPRLSAKKISTAEIVIHDRQSLRDPNVLFAPLAAKWDGYAGQFTVRVTKKFPELFVGWLQGLSPEIKVELLGELATLIDAPLAGSVRLDVAEAGIDWFDLSVVLDVADTTLTPEEIKLLLNARGGFVRLGAKGWRRLAFNLTPEEDEKLANLGLSPRELTAEPQRLHALQLANTAAKKFLSENQFERVQRRAEEIKARVTPEIPVGVGGELRPYQRDGFHFLAYLSENRFGGILADDMGLGKTLQALTWLAWLRENYLPRVTVPEINGEKSSNAKGNQKRAAGLPPSLVVCPKSVMDNWRAEAEHFTPALRVKIWSADNLKLFSTRLPDADLHVLNYSQLRSLGESILPQPWHAVILDEGQYIKNPASLTAQIARKLRAEHRLVLSGTPIENRLTDLWSLMAFAMPGALGSRAQFAKLYDAKEDPFARRRLSARVRPFLLRRTKSQVAKDLPERIEEDLFCEIEGEQKLLYRAELKRAQQMLLNVQTNKQLSQERFNFLTSLLRLRQICCHPRLVKADSKAPSAKVEAMMEQLEPLIDEGHKVLVFSQFVTMLDILRPEIQARGWPNFYLAGDTENRGDLVRQFQAAEGAAVFLISLKAGGFGLNLTAASYVVLFDPWWNPAVENQAIDRTHRIGQQRNVIAYRLLIKDSIEEKIRGLQKKKSAMADDVLGEEKFSQSLTLDDMRFLLA
jgi:hypothetical protein